MPAYLRIRRSNAKITSKKQLPHTVFRLQTFLLATNCQLLFSTTIVSLKAKRGRLACLAKDVNILDFHACAEQILEFSTCVFLWVKRAGCCDCGTRVSPCYRLPTFGMPRVYKKKGSKNKWTDEQLREGLGKIKTGELSLRAAAITYDIPKSTLSDHLRGTGSKR